MAEGILLESGTNEMELLTFRLADTPFGINVAKVREIIQRPSVIKIPHAPPMVEGSFKLRDEVLTLVNIGKHFGMEGEEIRKGEGLIIVVEFNQVRCGVLVDTVDAIHRLRWDHIEPPSSYFNSMQIPITGVAHVGDDIVMVVDFETIIGDVLGAPSVMDVDEPDYELPDRKDLRILLADDSSVLRMSMEKVLRKSGYQTLTICQDGQEAWDYLEQHADAENGPCDLVLTDIEMPRMDGLHLTSRIKEHPKMRNVPVVIFSSLITGDNIKKCKAVGADAQLSKPDGKGVVQAIENCMAQRAGKEVE